MVTYRLQHFPAVCVHCLVSLSKNNHSSIYSYHNELESTVDTAILRLINDETSTLQSLNPAVRDRLVPDKICKHCLDAIITFHKFRRRMECVRKFSAGLAQLIQGNPVDLIELYTSQGTYLAQVMKSLMICDPDEQNITIEKLIEDLSSFEMIDNSQKTQYTVLDTATGEPPLQEKMPPSTWPVLTNGTASLGVTVNAESVTEEILPDTHGTDVPVVVLIDSDDEEEDHGDQPMEANWTVANHNSHGNPYTPSANTMVNQTQQHSSDLTQGQKAFQSTNTVMQQNSRFFTSHPTATFYCTMCTKKYKTCANLEKHFAKVHNNWFLCTVCGETFVLADQLKTHKEIAHNIRCYFYCNICLEILPTAERLANHTARHMKPNPSECGQCLRSFRNANYFKTHLCITYRDDYVCCEKDFAGPIYYNMHMKTVHNIMVDARVKIPPGVLLSKLRPELGGMDFYCKFCDIRLDNRENYQVHIESSSHMMHALVIP